MNAEPEMPVGFDNRLGDNWRLLLAIAELAGDTFAEQARQAASKLSKVADVASTSERVLADIREIFDGLDHLKRDEINRLSSADLVARLAAVYISCVA
jgi:Protein of unknown function (DUF3631)